MARGLANEGLQKCVVTPSVCVQNFSQVSFGGNAFGECVQKFHRQRHRWTTPRWNGLRLNGLRLKVDYLSLLRNEFSKPVIVDCRESVGSWKLYHIYKKSQELREYAPYYWALCLLDQDTIIWAESIELTMPTIQINIQGLCSERTLWPSGQGQ